MLMMPRGKIHQLMATKQNFKSFENQQKLHERKKNHPPCLSDIKIIYIY